MTATELKKRAIALAEKTKIDSVTPEEVGQLSNDIVEYIENVEINGSSLGIRKTYTSVSAMEADSTAPKDDKGVLLRRGMLVNIYNQSDPDSADNGKVFSFQNPGWAFRGTVDAGYATKEELTELDGRITSSTSGRMIEIPLDINEGDTIYYGYYGEVEGKSIGCFLFKNEEDYVSLPSKAGEINSYTASEKFIKIRYYNNTGNSNFTGFVCKDGYNLVSAIENQKTLKESVNKNKQDIDTEFQTLRGILFFGIVEQKEGNTTSVQIDNPYLLLKNRTISIKLTSVDDGNKVGIYAIREDDSFTFIGSLSDLSSNIQYTLLEDYKGIRAYCTAPKTKNIGLSISYSGDFPTLSQNLSDATQKITSLSTIINNLIDKGLIFLSYNEEENAYSFEPTQTFGTKTSAFVSRLVQKEGILLTVEGIKLYATEPNVKCAVYAIADFNKKANLSVSDKIAEFEINDFPTSKDGLENKISFEGRNIKAPTNKYLVFVFTVTSESAKLEPYIYRKTEYDGVIPYNNMTGTLYKNTIVDFAEDLTLSIGSVNSQSYGTFGQIELKLYADNTLNKLLENVEKISSLEQRIDETLDKTSNILRVYDTPPLNILILGDSYSQNGGQWIRPMMSYLPNGSSWVSLAVSSASVRDKHQDRNTYPYTSRPISSESSGNLNTLACQIEKLKRLMAGIDLDDGESKLYATEEDYPNVIIIEGGMNDNYDSDEVESTYFDQFEKKVDNVYIQKNSSTGITQGSCYIKTPIEEVNRTCFAGAYRYLVEELLALFPNAQIFFTTASGLGYWNGSVVQTRYRTAEQQRKCANLCAASVIDWSADGQINGIVNHPSGTGTKDDPYIWAATTNTGYNDTNDAMHPNQRGGNKYGKLAALTIVQKFLNMVE